MVNAFASMTAAEKKSVIERLIEVHPTLNIDWGPGWSYRRCRKLAGGEVPSHVDELIWRRGVHAKLGRANPEGFQVLYLADRQETALAEARVAHDPAVIAEFVIQPGKSVRVVPIGELAQVQRTGHGFLAGESSGTLSNLINACSYADAMSLLITDAFLLECLAGHDDYNITSHVALCLFKKNSAVGAVAYPSRRQNGALNFAVLIGGFWDTWALSSVRLGTAKHMAMGYFDMRTTKAVSGISDDGRLQWQDITRERTGLLLNPPYVFRHKIR